MIARRPATAGKRSAGISGGFAVRLLVAMLLLAMGPNVVRQARAETSEWQQRVIPGGPKAKRPAPAPGDDATALPKAKSKAKVKSQEVAPAQVPKGVVPGAAAPARKAGPALGAPTKPHETVVAKPTGERPDPAYEAFDQGKYLTALALAQKAAEGGDPQAHTLVGRIHAEGLGVPQDAGLAAKWYAKAAELGDIEAAFALGVLYARGSGVKKDLARAAGLFETAALKGHPEANYNLALLFLRGQGKTENPQRAFAHMSYAAEKGVVPAQYDLGTLYATGTGTDPNAFEAARWIGKAAVAGHTEAELEYAIILFKGHGVPPDPKRGVELLRAAAEKDSAVAQNRLARCLAHGLGVAVDLVEAAKWHAIARGGGIEDAHLDKLVAKLSRTDRAKAERAATEWRERSQIQ